MVHHHLRIKFQQLIHQRLTLRLMTQAQRRMKKRINRLLLQTMTKMKVKVRKLKEEKSLTKIPIRKIRTTIPKQQKKSASL